jgi:hypothetical protein
MTTLGEQEEVEARSVRFEGEMLFIELSDGRQLGLPYTKITWLDWLAQATVEQRLNWSIEPYGYAIWWDDLDDGIEVVHALSQHPLPHKRVAESASPVLALQNQ